MGSQNTGSYKHALVFGASGVSGWAVINQLLQGYPNNERWDRVTALTNRPLSLEVSQWSSNDNLQIISGIDLLLGTQDDLSDVMSKRIANVESVTHIFYYGKNTRVSLVHKHLWLILTSL